MGIRIKYDVDSEYVVPKTSDLDIETLSLSDLMGSSSSNSGDLANATVETKSKSDSGAGSQWSSLTLNINLQAPEEISEAVISVVEKMDSIMEIFLTAYKILRILSSDLLNISRILKLTLKVIIKNIKEMIAGLSSVGFYSCIINPDFDTKGQKYAMPINGGFREYQERVQASLLNSKDPGAPKFGAGDTVGGVFLASIAGINDPDMLSNLIHNFKVIGQFFNFKGFNIQPPQGLRAIPGFYKKDGELKLGVKLTWTHGGEYVSGFELNRNIKDVKGIYNEILDDNSVIEVYSNEGFNPDPARNFYPVEVRQTTAKTKYTYIDFNVEGGKKYYYKAYSYLGKDSKKFFDEDPKLRDLNSPVASNTATASPHAKIPLSALKGRTLLDKKGMLVMPIDLAGEWKSISMRAFLGPALDKLFDRVDNIADILDGSIVIGTDAVTNYIKFAQKKLQKILDILYAVDDIIEVVARFSLRGTLAVLTLPPEVGGMEGLALRFNDACGTPTTADAKENSNSNVYASAGKGINPFDEASEQGVMFGLVLVYGFPSIDGDYFKSYARPLAKTAENWEDQYAKSQKAVKTVLGLLGLS